MSFMIRLQSRLRKEKNDSPITSILMKCANKFRKEDEKSQQLHQPHRQSRINQTRLLGTRNMEATKKKTR